MSIWTDLLFLGGHIATPTGLAAAAPEVITAPCAAADAAPAPSLARAVARPPMKPPIRPGRVSPNELGW